MLDSYKKHVEERKSQNIPPLPLDADQTSQLVELLKSEHAEAELLIHLLKALALDVAAETLFVFYLVHFLSFFLILFFIKSLRDTAG